MNAQRKKKQRINADKEGCMMDKPKKCPYCGGKKVKIRFGINTDIHAPGFYAQCEKCGAATIVVIDAKAAVRVWNRGEASRC